MTLLERIATAIDNLTLGRLPLDEQYRVPRGLMGRLVGNRMAEQHAPENAWTVDLLAPEPTDLVLEVGFGPGLTVERLAARLPRGRVAGVDLSVAMVRAARLRNARAVRAGRVELLHGDAGRLPFPDGAFDRALSVHSLYFWPDPDRVLEELRRVLRPGGRLVLTLLPRERWPGDGAGTAECRVYDGEEVASMMLRAGFSRAWVEPGDRALFREVAACAVK